MVGAHLDSTEHHDVQLAAAGRFAPAQEHEGRDVELRRGRGGGDRIDAVVAASPNAVISAGARSSTAVTNNNAPGARTSTPAPGATWIGPASMPPPALT